MQANAGPADAVAGQLLVLAGLRALAVAALAGALSGAVALGMGSRLAMRVTALQSSSLDQGALTDAQATVGEISSGGTIALVLLGAAAGAIGGLLYAAARRRVAWAGRWRGLVFGLVLLAVFGSALVEVSNPDFDRFGVPLVNVTMFGALFVFFGALVAPVYESLQCAVPRPSPSRIPRAVAAAEVGGVLLLPFAALLVLSAFLLDAGEQPVSGFVLVALICYVLASGAWTAGQHALAARRSGGVRLALGALAPLAPAVAVGVALDARELLAII